MLSGEFESRKSASTGEFALIVQWQASSELLLLQSDTAIPYLASRTYFYKTTRSPYNVQAIFCIGGQFENEVVNLTSGDYNGKWFFSQNHEIWFLMLFWGYVQYKVIGSVFGIKYHISWFSLKNHFPLYNLHKSNWPLHFQIDLQCKNKLL